MRNLKIWILCATVSLGLSGNPINGATEQQPAPIYLTDDTGMDTPCSPYPECLLGDPD